MAVHKLLVDDFEDANYSLLAIHCDIEDYRLAYFLNQNLATRLVRTKEDLDFSNSAASFLFLNGMTSLYKRHGISLKTIV